MRVIAGSHRGRRLSGPQGTALRPTSDKVREAIFSILGTQVSGGRFLDLYAGTGAVGIEALSRGASVVTFVESDPNFFREIFRPVSCSTELKFVSDGQPPSLSGETGGAAPMTYSLRIRPMPL